MMPLRSILLVACCAIGAAIADAPSSGYAAPAASNTGYAAPQASYGEPTGYAAPSTGYDAGGQQSYDYSSGGQSYSAPGYDAPADSGFDLGFDLSKLYVLLPLFLAVLVAIIIAALIGPFLAQLGVILVGILPMAIDIKAPIINAILAPLSLTLCTPNADGTTGTVFPTNGGRAMADEASAWGLDNLSQENMDTIYYVARTVAETFMGREV